MEQSTKTVLFLPFLQIPSGHHQVANTLIDGLKQIHPHIKCEKVDILAYSYGKVENLISSVYLKWIKIFPKTYNLVYRKVVIKDNQEEKRYRLYELLFLPFIKRLIRERKPDLIVCTHSLPAYMLNHLKEREGLKIPVANVYTDYFVHRLWGTKNIEFHFAPSSSMKGYLKEKGVREERIFVTGIPVHSKIRKVDSTKFSKVRDTYNFLITGGNLGVGAIEELIKQFKDYVSPLKVKFFILCGKNKRLLERLISLQMEHLVPYPYIDCMEKMNHLYDEIDAVITKPGGVTISECLSKSKPIFIYHALPGQEKINLQELQKLGVVFLLNKDKPFEHLFALLQEEQALLDYQQRVAAYQQDVQSTEPAEILASFLG
ncbi:MGDG synthase family glycosyltransferase [Robertmurraya kyonggiensis]|uniref:UDP-glucuronosyltransferase n=1 Tax=Robertmurraya kyonggiensis TaxID=1037680 RepID=A0A4U1DAD3_9BACI|nr:glycosyltransferase [Robertmurraya kyonggiensis]TKC19529.1 UDP-glucuronosyltransferase [Robertmurraya kyonggiensis]